MVMVTTAGARNDAAMTRIPTTIDAWCPSWLYAANCAPHRPAKTRELRFDNTARNTVRKPCGGDVTPDDVEASVGGRRNRMCRTYGRSSAVHGHLRDVDRSHLRPGHNGGPVVPASGTCPGSTVAGDVQVARAQRSQTVEVSRDSKCAPAHGMVGVRSDHGPVELIA